MIDPIWLLESVACTIHDRQIAEHGGLAGIRDQGLLQSALSRPLNIFAYNTSIALCDLAAAYAYGIAKNHPFLDGNKRTAFMTAYVFLGINGFELIADEESAAEIMLRLAGGDIDEAGFAAWLADNIREIK